MIRKTFLSVSISLFLLASSVAQVPSGSASVANRRTAIRYLQLASQYINEKSLREADSNIELGLAYDDTIPDLWYLKALSASMRDAPKAEIIPFVEKSLQLGKWAQSNRDAARVLYADLLCETLRYEESLQVLDEKPLIYSSDAEFIRVKDYYGLGTNDFRDARGRINVARKVYPEDPRFALLFFRREYANMRKNIPVSDDVKMLAAKFVQAVDFYKNPSDELCLYAAIFSDGEEKERKLKKFQAEEKKAPLFAQVALEAGIINDFEALDFFYKFADSVIDISVVEPFVRAVKDEKARKELSDYFNSYDGIISVDTDGDLNANIIVKYKRGRTEAMVYDRNQDGSIDWVCECDFGSPTKLHVAKDSLDITYVNWPDVYKAVYNLESKHSDLVFNLVAENVAYSPFAIDYNEVLKDALDVEFYLPLLIDDDAITRSDFIKAASSYEIPSSERENAVVNVSLLDGVTQGAKYYDGERLYAFAEFENGRPVRRLVDKDNDGFFETTEIYSFTQNKNEKFLSQEDEVQMITNLYGQPSLSDGCYLKMIQVDMNCDTVPEFIEEYTAGLGKISSWDFDFDGKWDVQYVLYPANGSKIVKEEAKFHQPFTNDVVTVTMENGKPVYVLVSGNDKGGRLTENRLLVEPGKNENFYWVAQVGDEVDEENIIKSVNQITSQGVSIIVTSENDRFLAIRIGQQIFGEKLPPSEIQEKAEQNK
ncbi:MAG: hypothetical protein IJP61_11630 [Treponema sp.]|nr:hypothetical protein [Treponema sp.]